MSSVGSEGPMFGTDKTKEKALLGGEVRVGTSSKFGQPWFEQ